MEVSERTRLEMERGRQVGERKQNFEFIDRLIESGILKLNDFEDRLTKKPTLEFVVNGVLVYRYDGDRDDINYPSPVLMAILHLGAKVSKKPVKEPTPPDRRQFSRSRYRFEGNQ